MNETRKIAAILAADVVGFSRLAGADEDRTLARLRALRSDLIDPTIALHHGRITDVSVVLHHSVWMDSESGLPDLDSTVVARIFPRRRHSVGVIDLRAAKTRPKWELSLKPQEKAMSVTVR